MPNNFRLTGVRYVSKAGHDSNDGLTKDTPKKSIMSGITAGDIIVGSGEYSGYTISNLGTSKIKGDGNVELKDMTISVNLINGLSIKGGSLAFGGTHHLIESSVVDSITNNPTVALITKSILINISMSCRILQNVILLNGSSTAISGTPICNNTYTSFTHTLVYLVEILPTNFRNNNIQGIITLQSEKYAIKDQYTGTPQDAGYASDVYWLSQANLTANGYTGTIVGWDAAVATCINRDPRFNDASKLDFTLKADSPHIGRASDGVSNIGGTNYAQSFYVGTASPNILLLEPSSTIDTTNNSDWKLQSGEIEGTIRAIIKVANTNEVITNLPYIGNKAFNSDSIGGTSTNFNVPDSKPTTSAYPSYLTTTATASDVYRVAIANHGFSAGVWLKVDGQYREVTSVTTNELIFLTAVRGIVSSGTAVQVGALNALSSLNPNRLNYLMRSSISDVVDSSNWDNPLTWDNNSLADAGDYLEQEWDRQPLIDNLNKCGFGDDNYDANYGNPIQVKYIDIIIYLRNNYKS